MPCIFVFLFFITLQESIYAMKRTNENQIVVPTNENFIFNEPFLKHCENTLNSTRYMPLNTGDIVLFKNIQETVELIKSISSVNQKAYFTLNIPFKKFLSNIRIAHESLLNENGEFDGKMFLDSFYKNGIPSDVNLQMLLNNRDENQFNFNNSLDTVEINTGCDVDGDPLTPLVIKRSFLQNILIADALSQDISNPNNLANQNNECMSYIDYDAGPDNEDQGNIMPYLLPCALFLKESSYKLPNHNIMPARNWIIKFFKRILYISDQNSIVFTDKNHAPQKKNVLYIFTNVNDEAYGVRAEGPNLVIFKKKTSLNN